nr:MAG TPA: hypothetical protein [Caudoviricetes sp.]
MEKQRKPRKSPVWDPIRKLTGQYQSKLRAAHKEIDAYAVAGRSGKVSTPSYGKEVIGPLAKTISEKLPDLNITVCDKVECVNPKDAYFRVQIGEHTLGGFSYPGPGVNQINFTVFAHGRPWGKAIEVAKLARLMEIISRLADFLDLDKHLQGDDQ